MKQAGSWNEKLGYCIAEGFELHVPKVPHYAAKKQTTWHEDFWPRQYIVELYAEKQGSADN